MLRLVVISLSCVLVAVGSGFVIFESSCDRVRLQLQHGPSGCSIGVLVVIGTIFRGEGENSPYYNQNPYTATRWSVLQLQADPITTALKNHKTGPYCNQNTRE